VAARPHPPVGKELIHLIPPWKFMSSFGQDFIEGPRAPDFGLGLHDTMTFSSWCIHGSACRAGGRFLLGRFRLDVWWYGVPLLLRGAVIDSIGCWDWQGGKINVRDGQWSRGIVVVYITFLRRNKVENLPSQQKTRLPRRPCPLACLIVRGYATHCNTKEGTMFIRQYK